MSKINHRYAQVVVNLPVQTAFTYKIPPRLNNQVETGKRVLVPFRNKELIGYIVGISKYSRIKKLKEIIRVLDTIPLLDRNALKLARQIADYYLCGWGEVMAAMLPASVRKRLQLKPSLLKKPVAYDSGETKILPEASPSPLVLTPAQNRALKSILKELNKDKFAVFLLHGITASGKTEIYLRSIAKVLSQGKTSNVLVPEIALTPQTIERFSARFGDKIAVLHSQLKPSQRREQWWKIKRGQASIVIGARSAIFAPMQNLGLIIIDEEHESTYKQEDAPRYNARQVALMRARLSDSIVILGSATPSLESYYSAKTRKSRLIHLPERTTPRGLPEVKIVDMKNYLGKRRRWSIFSPPLVEAIRQSLSGHQQVMLFLNRRGFARFVRCLKCGYVMRCPRCHIALTFHYDAKSLLCHYCNYRIGSPEICPECRSDYLRYVGMGTQKVESEIHRLFPEARIGRMDSDAMTNHDLYTQIFNEYKYHRIDILIGTQMIAKGLDFPRVSLVGVISADTSLNLPDFRAGERTFNLITQVAGRAGRGLVEGKVIIQTYNPQNYAVQASLKHDYFKFYKTEIKSRKDLYLPPFSHIATVMIRGFKETVVVEQVEKLAKVLSRLKKPKGMLLIGPAPAIIPKIRGKHRWNILLKAKSVEELNKVLSKALKKYKRHRKTILTVDIDPL